MSDFFDSYGNLINLVLLNGLLAYSVMLVLSANMFSLATGGLMAIGAYTSVHLSMVVGAPFVVAILSGGAAAACFALLVGMPVLRLRGDYFALATLAFTEVVRVVAVNWDDMTGGALGIFNIPAETRTWHLGLLLLVVVYLFWAVRHSHFGRAIDAIRHDETPTAAMGIHIYRYRLSLFVASGAVAGLAGGLGAHMNYFIGPNDFGLARTIDAVAYPVLGGITHLLGPLLGAFVFTLLPEALRFSAQWREVFAGVLMLAIVLFLPGGLTSVASRLLRKPRLKPPAASDPHDEAKLGKVRP